MKKLIFPGLITLTVSLFGFWQFLPQSPNKFKTVQQTQVPAQLPVATDLAPPHPVNSKAPQQISVDGVDAAALTKPDIESPQIPNTPAGYRDFQAGNYFAALQAFEAARWQDMDAVGFYGDLLGFCKGQRFGNRSQLERWIAHTRATPTATTESDVWITSKSFEVCANYRSPPINPQTMPMFSALSRKKKAEIGPIPAPEARRNWFDQRVVNAKRIDTLWQLADGRSRGAVGANYFNLDTEQDDGYGYNSSPASASLSQAQTVAIMRLRCDMTRACGPEQLDSLLVCARYLQCRPGISVEEVWRSVASPYELQAAQAIYQQYVALRAVPRK